ncbi:hypothetical protein GCM10010413_46830 [Promicromonospora sukumoe]|uniref:Uncharacterized protein n=1 Tax=Promicromonospora sukumoe TaxID=88382 RepID=A0A7W3JCF0_9MICO|nr:hypothetical protein [Promicromonospora sukumoe]MBA8810248.1 hypothetical protein [Promicromonospora sukumoe]
MERVIDLDVLADRLRPVMNEWGRWATVSPLTWRDAEAWPRQITPDRSSIQVPESVGFVVHRRQSDDVLAITAWTGGWTDLEYQIEEGPFNFSPFYRDTDEACTAVIKDVEEFGEIR